MRVSRFSTWVLGGSLAAAASSVHAASFSDVLAWVGSGSEQAALVIDFNTGPTPQSLLWGYRHDGSATGQDMIFAVTDADPKLYIKYGESGSFGRPLYGFGYDVDGDGFALDDATVFDAGGKALIPNSQLGTFSMPGDADGAAAVDPDDVWVEGWFTGYAELWVSYDGTTWQAPIHPITMDFFGMTNHDLGIFPWAGWSFSSDFSSSEPSEPTAALIPEPTALAVLSLLGVVAMAKRRARA